MVEAIKNFKVYSLVCPIDKESVRYIGYTKFTLEKRLDEHFREDYKKTHKCNWMKSLKVNGLMPIIELIEDAIPNKEQALMSEIAYIKLFKSFGAKLVNTTNGGEGGEMTEETKYKIRQKRKLQIITQETKDKLSAAGKNRKHTKESRMKQSLSQTGKKKTPMSLQARENISIAMTGKKKSESARKNMSECQKGEKSYWFGKKQTQETKDKRTLSLIGSKRTLHQKNNISEGGRYAWERIRQEKLTMIF